MADIHPSSRLLKLASLVCATWWVAQPACAALMGIPQDLVGLWRVQDGACAGCDPSQGAETGADLRIGEDSYQNPFGSDCGAGASVVPLAPEALSLARDRLGLPPRWSAGAPDSAQVKGYRLICGGTARETVLLLPDGTLLLPQEASTVLRLTRQN